MIHKFSILLLCSILIDINGLNCRTEGSLKSDELKNIFNNCIRQHEGKNVSSNKNTSEDWADSSDRIENGGNRKMNREEAKNWMDDRSDRSVYESRDRQNNRDQDMNGRNQYNGKSYQNERHNRDRMNSNRHTGSQEEETRGNVNNYQNDNYKKQDFYQDGSEPQRNNMYSFPTHRYKRERSEKNSGQRSQYNPNPSRNDENYRDKNSNDSSKSGKACAMHCFLDNLHMTGENGMPDRYLVTNAMTKDVRNEDLRDFLQESIEECFQILDNENTEDKCEFSKNLLICLSEKGRATCDDWKDDVQFT